MARTVVVLGAGTGGVSAAERLRASLPSDNRVVLIDRSFTGSLGLSSLRVLRGWRRPEDVVTTIGPDALPGVTMVTGEVVGVGPETKTVSYRAGDSVVDVGYDAVVVALGAGLDIGAVPGLDDALASGAAAEFYTLDGAAGLHRRIDAVSSGRIVVLIPALPFKCPPAPYEAAFLIADQLGERFTGGAVRVEVITCEPRPIPVVGPDVGAAVAGMLAARGIGFHPGKTTRAIDPEARTIAFTDGSSEPFDLLAVVPPHTSPAPAVLPGAVNAGGWIPVDAGTLATGLAGVWAIGDNAALTLAHGMPLPKAGIFAEGAALTAADQIVRYLGYDAPDTRFAADGGCIMEVGGGLAAKVAGTFLAEPAPRVLMYEPSTEFHVAKEQQESDWLARWNHPTQGSP